MGTPSSVVDLLVLTCLTPCLFLLLVLVLSGDVGGRLSFAGTWVGTGGAVTVGLFLGGTGTDCVPTCWSTAVWLTYGVGGTLTGGVRGDVTSTEVSLGGMDPCGVACPHGMDLLWFEDCGPVEPDVRFRRGSKMGRSSGCNGDASTGCMGWKCTFGLAFIAGASVGDIGYIPLLFNC